MLFDDVFCGGTTMTILVKLLLAALAGAMIGIEREKHGRPAGLRTHLLVALGSCLMMIISESFYLKYGQLAGTGVLRVDPSRVAAQIVAGIGFIYSLKIRGGWSEEINNQHCSNNTKVRPCNGLDGFVLA